MAQLIVETLDQKKVARVERLGRGKFEVFSRRSRVKALIQRTIADASDNPIPLLLGNKVVRTKKGHVNRSEGAFFGPKDDGFLDALADALARHEFYAYTVEDE